MASESERKKSSELVRETARKLGENFDSVLILATSHDEAGTIRYEFGVGNYYARLGQLREFIIQMDEEIRQQKREQMREDSP